MEKAIDILKGLLVSLGSALLSLVAVVILYLFVIQPRNLNWGLEAKAASRRFPGDDLLRKPDYVSTHALAIDAPAEKVWPWLVQIGQNRGGFYSYTWIENLLGMRMRNADRIVPQWQELAAGDEINLAPRNGMVVAAIEKPRHIVCQMPLGRKSTWAFILEPLGEGKSRLISRIRMDLGDKPRRELLFFDIGHFIMDRKMLMGIKMRAEREAGASSLFATAEWAWGLAMILCGLSIPVLFVYHRRPWNGISAGTMGIFWVVGVFCSYASLPAAIFFVALLVLAFALPKRWRRRVGSG
jgi:hypothetical protein